MNTLQKSLTNLLASLDALDATHQEQTHEALQKLMGLQSDSARLAILDGANGETQLVILPKVAIVAMNSIIQAYGLLAKTDVNLTPRRVDLSTQEAANFLGISRPFLISQIQLGRIPHIKIGSKRRLTKEDLEVYRQDYLTPKVTS